MSPPDGSAPQFLEMGYVSGPHGIRGEVKLHLHNPQSEALRRGALLTLRDRTGREQSYSIGQVRSVRKGMIVQLQGVDNRNQAEALKGSTIVASVDELPPLGADEAYLEALRGYRVIDDEGRELGRIQSFLFTNISILVVSGGGVGEVLLPILDDTIRSVDEENEILRIRVPEGLVE